MHAPRPRSQRLIIIVAVLALTGCTGEAGPTATAGQTPGPTTAASTSATPSSEPIATATEAPTAEPTAPATTEPSATPAGPTLPPPTGAWRPAPTQASLTATQLQDVVWTGSRFFAVGSGDTAGAFLDSTDGRTWRTHDTGATNALPSRVANGPSGLVVIGTVGGKVASWVSPDAVHWTWHSSNFPTALGKGDTFSVTDVVATTTGWLAVGREDPICDFNCGLAPVRALAWTSTDGLAWTRVTGQTAFEGGGITGVAAAGTGFVAAGLAGGHAAIWTSPDGLTWARVADAAVFGPPSGTGSGATVSANGVAAGHGSIVVVGMAFDAGAGGEPIVMAWRSTDGTTWTAATVDVGAGGQVFSVAATANRFLATGPSGEGSCLGGVWSSTDGTAWSCEATDPAFSGFGPYAAAGSPTIEVAVGLTSVGWDPNGGAGMPGAAWWRAAG